MITQEQILERKNYIGGSDAAGVLNMSRWDSPISVWLRKGENAKIENTENLATELGNELEEVVARLFEKRTALKTRKMNLTIYHSKHKYIACHIDRKIEGENAFLECKTTSQWNAKEWEGEEIPQEYIIQCLHILNCTEYDYCYIAVLIGNKEFKFKKIEKDKELQEKILNEEIYFWNEYVLKKQIPNIITYFDKENIEKIYPKVKNIKIIEVNDNEFENKIEKMIEMENKIKKLNKEIDLIKNEIKIKIGENEGLKTNKYIFTWKDIEKKEYVVPAKKYRELRKKEIK